MISMFNTITYHGDHDVIMDSSGISLSILHRLQIIKPIICLFTPDDPTLTANMMSLSQICTHTMHDPTLLALQLWWWVPLSTQTVNTAKARTNSLSLHTEHKWHFKLFGHVGPDFYVKYTCLVSFYTKVRHVFNHSKKRFQLRMMQTQWLTHATSLASFLLLSRCYLLYLVS